MTYRKATDLLGDRAYWELVEMKRAWSLFSFLNTEAENERLTAVKVLLKIKILKGQGVR